MGRRGRLRIMGEGEVSQQSVGADTRFVKVVTLTFRAYYWGGGTDLKK